MILRIIAGIFLILHGLVHLLYAGQSRRYFELRPGMVWPDGAWAFSRLIGNETIRTLAGILLVLATLSFVVGGLGLLFQQAWWRPVTTGAAVLSSAIFLLFWNGKFQALDAQGGFALLINLAILVAAVLLK
ncbi:MAG: hypothetical protein EHM21_10410 [Chloroflexi bacterium]|nr:MAG: hypothetical protein EHM21_10410 [Chloroflexota bacterium]